MKTQHTPGPWEISNNIHGIDNVKCWGVECHIENKDETSLGGPQFYTRTIANCGSDGKANARLIARAPELLSACEQALAGLKNPESDEFDAQALQDVLESIVSKAKGEL